MIQNYGYIIKTEVLVMLFLFLSHTLVGQISIHPSEGRTPEEIVKEFVMGDGVTITNVKFNGSSGVLKKRVSAQLGTFSNDKKGFPDFFSSGIILCTGDCKMAEGPNNDESKTAHVGSYAGNFFSHKCKDLESIVNPSSLYHPAVLEFDFSSVTKYVRFRYVFASEEYPVFSCSNFNDVFGFFVTYPYKRKTHNIALIPGTDKAVSVNNIHPYFCKGCEAVHEEYITMLPPGCPKMQFNGYVGPFEAVADLEPNKTYHIKLAISNVSDMELESAVFLEASSFSAVDENGIVIMGDGSPATYSKTDTLSGRTAQGIPMNDLYDGKGATGIDLQEIGKYAIDPEHYIISAETTYDYLFDSVSASVEKDSLVVALYARGQWCDCFYPDEIPVSVIMIPKSLGEDGSQLEKIVIPVVVPIIEKHSWLIRCFPVLIVLVALLVFLIYLRGLLKKNRFHKKARLKNSYVVEDSPMETQKNGKPLRKPGFGAWLNRWFNPFGDEKNTISFSRPKTPAMTFMASGSKNKVLLGNGYDPEKMTVPMYNPQPQDKDKSKEREPIPIYAGTAIEIKKTQGGETTCLGHVKYNVQGKDNVDGYRFFIGLLMLLVTIGVGVIVFTMIKSLL
jgi:hypothetical protein